MQTKRASRKSCCAGLHTPDDEHLRQFFWDVTPHALRNHSAEQRDVFITNRTDGETLHSISDQTGVNIKTLSRERYARCICASGWQTRAKKPARTLLK